MPGTRLDRAQMMLFAQFYPRFLCMHCCCVSTMEALVMHKMPEQQANKVSSFIFTHKFFCGVDIFENPWERENMCAEFTRDIKFMFALERVELYLLVTSFTLVCSGSSCALKNKNVHIQNHWCVVEGISLNAFLCVEEKKNWHSF